MLEKPPIRRATIRRQVPASPLISRTMLPVLLALAFVSLAPAQTSSAPAQLKCDSLTTPLGIDSQAPEFSWQLRDTRSGARQTAYRIQVASSRARLQQNKPDVWDSGKKESEQSLGVRYDGAKLDAEHRYFWRVSIWDKDGKPYPLSEITWWETGLLSDHWKANWIGYEEAEHRRVRQANATWITNPGVSNFHQAGDTHHAFRLRFTISKPVKRADLFVAGEDSASAWLNGKPVMQASPLSPWMKLPWKAYSRKDVSAELREGENLLAVDVVLYAKADDTRTSNHSFGPMNATLYIENTDGSVQIEKSGEGAWRSALDPDGKWQSPEFEDRSWQAGTPYQPQNGAESVGYPWRTGAVKMLRRAFSVSRPILSARLYVTALGAYKFFLNGKAVGDQVLAPGWMDFREHVAYQVYDVTVLVKRGRNAMGVLLAPGWYTTPLAWYGQGYNYGDTPPALLAQLRLEHADGSVEWVTTDASWKAEASPILSAEIYNGETYDARKAQPGWNTAQFSGAKWQPAQIIEPRPLKIVA